MADSIKQRHAGSPIGECTGDRQAQVDVPECFGCLGDARGQFGVFHWTGCFGPVELHTTNTEHRQNSNGQHDDTHAPQPLQLLAIKLNRFRQLIDADNNG